MGKLSGPLSVIHPPSWTEVMLVFYINIGNMSTEDAVEYINNVRQQTAYDKPPGTAPWFYIPIREGETRVECLNPILISDQSKVDQALNQLQEIEAAFNNNLLVLDKPNKFYLNKSKV
jgi:hypothetical protein